MWCCRQWLGSKIGSGNDSHREGIKDLLCFMLRCRWQNKDTLQQLLLWMRYMYGNMHVTPYEEQACKLLGLVAGSPPDYAAIDKQYKDFDTQRDPWVIDGVVPKGKLPTF